jgi:hypothetical protein
VKRGDVGAKGRMVDWWGRLCGRVGETTGNLNFSTPTQFLKNWRSPGPILLNTRTLMKYAF